MQDTILGLDIGTNSTKAVLFDLAGQELATAQQGYRLHTPQPGWAEQNPEEVWQAVIAVLQSIAAAAAGHWRIRALALAAQSGSLIPTRADGTVVCPMITWLDGRTEALVKQWQADGREETIRQLSGWWLHPGLPFPNIGWLRQFRPNTFAQVERFLGVLDFLNYRLSGHFCTDFSAGAEMQLVDVTAGRWSEQLCALVGITPNQLARLEPAGRVIGPVDSDVCALTGLPGDTLVINGGHDQCCTALAMGMTEPGKLMLASGTAWVITAITDSPAVKSAPASMDLNFHVVPRRWTVSQLLGGFGATVEWWLRENLQMVVAGNNLSPVELYQHLNRILAASEPGSHNLHFLPLSGGAQLSAAKPWGGFVGLRLDHTRADMARAILEGAAFEVRWALENVRQVGLPVEQVWLAGGATHSPIWPQILADVTGVTISLTDYANWPALGAAILAGFGAGIFDTLEAGIACLQKAGRQVTPIETHRPVYDQQFTDYQRISRILAQV
ncbi:MAG TPA: FGGY family carbohydrate kinase [Anaerolineae bacterium]|nr:FGGY family carbohydrate kinase [Anaerolineae bacterium]